MRMVVSNFNRQIRAMVNNLDAHIRTMIHNSILSAITWIVVWPYINVGIVVNDFNTQIRAMVNDFDIAIERKGFTIFPCDCTSVFVNCQVRPSLNGLSFGSIPY